MCPDIFLQAGLCSQCARSVDSSGSLSVDEERIICSECYLKMLAPDHRSAMMELFDIQKGANTMDAF